MSRIDNEIRITPPVLDRLIDYEPELSREPLLSRAQSLRQLKQSVKRDLEWLLNTRQSSFNISPELKEVNNSLAVFGLPDFTAANARNIDDEERMRREIESTIRIFEPRLQDVIVTIEPVFENQRALHFRIDAHLRIEPAPEPVTFDTLLQLDNGEYSIKEA